MHTAFAHQLQLSAAAYHAPYIWTAGFQAGGVIGVVIAPAMAMFKGKKDLNYVLRVIGTTAVTTTAVSGACMGQGTTGSAWSHGAAHGVNAPTAFRAELSGPKNQSLGHAPYSHACTGLMFQRSPHPSLPAQASCVPPSSYAWTRRACTTVCTACTTTRARTAVTPLRRCTSVLYPALPISYHIISCPAPRSPQRGAAPCMHAYSTGERLLLSAQPSARRSCLRPHAPHADAYAYAHREGAPAGQPAGTAGIKPAS